MKKVIAILLCLCMMMGLIPAQAAQIVSEEKLDESEMLSIQNSDLSGKCGANVYYAFDSGTGTLTIYGKGEMDDFDFITTDGSAIILSPWFEIREQITSVVIEEGVTYIGDWSFYDCEALTEVNLPDSLISIGTLIFASCTSLESIEIPSGVERIGDIAFSYSGLTKVLIPASVEYIGEDAFFDTPLSEIDYTGSKEQWENIELIDAYLLNGIYDGRITIKYLQMQEPVQYYRVVAANSQECIVNGSGPAEKVYKIVDAKGNPMSGIELSYRLSSDNSLNMVTTDSKGMVTVRTPNLTAGQESKTYAYTVDFFCNTLENLKDSRQSFTVRVNPIIEKTGTVQDAGPMNLTITGSGSISKWYQLVDGNGSPMTGISLSYRISGDSTLYINKTDSRGRIEIRTPNLTAGQEKKTYRYTVDFTCDSLDTLNGNHQEFSVEVIPEKKTTYFIEDAGLGDIQINGSGYGIKWFRVEDETGHPAPGITLNYTVSGMTNGKSSAVGSSDENGLIGVKTPILKSSEDCDAVYSGKVSFSGADDSHFENCEQTFKVTVTPLKKAEGWSGLLTKSAGLYYDQSVEEWTARAAEGSYLSILKEMDGSHTDLSIDVTWSRGLETNEALGISLPVVSLNNTSNSYNAKYTTGMGTTIKDFDPSNPKHLGIVGFYILEAASSGTSNSVTGGLSSVIAQICAEIPKTHTRQQASVTVSSGESIQPIEASISSGTLGINKINFNVLSAPVVGKFKDYDEYYTFTDIQNQDTGTWTSRVEATSIAGESSSAIIGGGALGPGTSFTEKGSYSVSGKLGTKTPSKIEFKESKQQDSEVGTFSVTARDRVEISTFDIGNNSDIFNTETKTIAEMRDAYIESGKNGKIEYQDSARERYTLSQEIKIPSEFSINPADSTNALKLELGGSIKASFIGDAYQTITTGNTAVCDGKTYDTFRNDSAKADSPKLFMQDLIEKALGQVGEIIRDSFKVVVDTGKQIVNDKLSVIQSKVTETKYSLLRMLIHSPRGMNTMALQDASGRCISTSIGDPYTILAFHDEALTQRLTETELKNENATIRLEYTAEMLEEAGVSADSRVNLFHMDAKTGGYVLVENAVQNKASMTVTAPLVASGEYILGVDNAAPEVLNPSFINMEGNTRFTAIVRDLSGVATISLSIDGREYVSGQDFVKYYDAGYSVFDYPLNNKLAEGKHILSLSATDKLGNQMEAIQYTLTIENLNAVIRNVIVPTQTVTGPFTVKADIDLPANVNLNDVWAKVQYTCGEMISYVDMTCGSDGQWTAEVPAVAGVSRMNLTVFVGDYNGNTVSSETAKTVRVNVPVDVKEFVYADTSISPDGNGTQIGFTVGNTAKSPAAPAMIASAYSQDGKQLAFVYSAIGLEAEGKKDILLHLDCDSDRVAYVKVFFLESYQSMLPESNALMFSRDGIIH